MQTPLISPKDIPDAVRSLLRHPGQAKREPGSHKGRRLNLLRSRIRLRLSGMTAAIWRTLLTRRASPVLPSRKRGSPGFTLMEMVVVLAIVGILASIVAPLVITALTRAREATLQQDLKTMRKLIDDYYGDKGAFPPSLQVLVTQGYLRAIPRDPVNGNKAEWKTVLAKEGGISDVRSLSNERGANGTPYADW
jgi:general secretion pathway protein G